MTESTDCPNNESPDGTPSLIQHVGLCLDRSPFGDRIVPHAVALAQVFGAKLTVLHALEPPHEGPKATPTDPLDWEVQRTEARRLEEPAKPHLRCRSEPGSSLSNPATTSGIGCGFRARAFFG